MIRATMFLVLLFFCCLPAIRGTAAETENVSVTEAVQTSDIVVDYSEEIIAVRANENNELYYGFGTSAKPPKTYQRIGTELIAEFQNGETTYEAFYIDLSALPFKQGSVFYAKYAEEGIAASIGLEAREKLKAVYNGVLPEDETGISFANAYGLKINGERLYRYFDEETGYLTFEYDSKDYAKLSNVEWRAGTAMNYKELSKLNLKVYQASGASLYFRVNSGDAPISKEAKLKIRKPAKAPSVKLDGNKLTLTVKDTQEYRLKYKDGKYTDWTAVEEDAKLIALAELQGMNGDGILVPFDELKIQVRSAASLKNCPSLSADIYLDVPLLPVSGEQGVTVEQVNPADITKGLIVNNASDRDYMIAIADMNAWECNGSVSELIQKIDYSARKGDVGYLTWKSVKAGASVTISYKQFEAFEDSYTVLFRAASVKENKSTADREFRITSVVKPVGGVLPKADLKSQAFMVEGGNTATKKISFDKVDGYTLYTSVDDTAFSKNTEWAVNISGKAGTTVLVKAYLTENETATPGETATYRYLFVTDGELPAYANDWGYIQCKKNGWAVAYQRAYLAAITYAESFSVEGLSMEIEEIMQVIKMMRLDNPEIIQLGSRYTLSGNKMILPMGDKTEMEKLLIECQNTAKTALQAIEAKYDRELTPIEYVKEIHDFIVLEKQYESSEMDQTMAGILTEAYTPVCSSYALAFHYMCELAGIQTVIVHGDAKNSSGDSEAHVWNMVNLGEMVDYARMLTVNGDPIDPADWYEIDITWDDPMGGQEDYVRYTYFNLTTDEMTNHSSGTKHIRSVGQAYDSYPVDKCTGTAYNYDYLVKNNYITVKK